MLLTSPTLKSFPSKQRSLLALSILCLISLVYFLIWRTYFSDQSFYGHDDILERIETNDLRVESIVRRGKGVVKPIIRLNPYREPLFTTPVASYYMVSKLFSIFENRITFRSQECQNKFEATCLKKDFVNLLRHLNKMSADTDSTTIYLILEDDVIVCNNMMDTVEQFQKDKSKCLYACGVGGTCIMMKPSCLAQTLRQYEISPKNHMDMVLWGGVPHKYLHSADHFAKVSTMGHNDGRIMKCKDQ